MSELPLLLPSLPKGDLLADAQREEDARRAFPWDTGLAKDVLCMCREFSTPSTGWGQRSGFDNSLCSTRSSDGRRRWRDASVPEGHERRGDGEIVAGGLHARAYIHRTTGEIEKELLVILFRHQEGESLFDGDMWEAMGLWGRNFVELSTGYGRPGTVLSRMCRILQLLIHRTRRLVGVDYVSRSVGLVDGIIAENRGVEVLFAGYSLGGAIAQLNAVRLGEMALLFASNGVADITRLYPKYFPGRLEGNHRVYNIFNSGDIIPKMDCQTGAVCPYPLKKDESMEDIHEKYVFGHGAERDLQETPKCIDGLLAWNEKQAFCESRHFEDHELLPIVAILALAAGFFIPAMVMLHNKKQKTS